jgi:ABC-type dipeptide/oligopeptide/nickel transport system permease component
MAVLARLTRSSILEVIREDYVRTARAKGLKQRVVTYRHVLRNSLIPVVTVIGLQFAGMLGGTVFIESVFARPGIGRFAVNAIAARDYPQVQGVVLFAATIYVVFNLAVDVLYGVLDPRIRYD